MVQATNAVDQSEKFAAGLDVLPLDIPAYDDAVFLDNGKKALVTAHDGKIWEVDFTANAAQPFVDMPLMAWGIHEAPRDPTPLYFCSAGSYEDRPGGEVAGLYRFDLSTRSNVPLVVNVPDTKTDKQHAVDYADDDSDALKLQADGSGHPSRKIAVYGGMIWRMVQPASLQKVFTLTTGFSMILTLDRRVRSQL